MKGNKQLILVVLLMMALALVACTENNDSAADSEIAVEATTEVAAVEPTVVPTKPPAALTDVPAEPAAKPVAPSVGSGQAAPVVEEPAAQRFGVLRIRDNDATPSGSFQLLMEGVSPAPAGTHYALWLIDDSFNTLNLGAFEVADGRVQYAGDTNQNLLAAYNSAFISIESDGVADGEIGPIAFDGVVPAGSLLHVNHIVTAFPANPNGQAFLVGAQGQLHHAMEHTGFLLDELANDNLREAQRHAEHVVNILDGETGANFGDLDGDTVAQNPGDGVGVRGYLEGAKQHAQLAVDAEDATAEVELHAGHVLISSDNSLARVDAAITQALRVIASDSAAEAQPAADELMRLLDAALDGVDVNNDGNVAPIPDEGGILTAYVHAQNMGSYEFFAADGTAVAAAPAGEATPTEAAPVTAKTVTIEMANFAFVPNEITVSAGTAVTWINKDNGPRHSATAVDGSFDTGLFDSGEEVTITLDTPGTYVYYCLLHGSPDGSGMAATITVTK